MHNTQYVQEQEHSAGVSQGTNCLTSRILRADTGTVPTVSFFRADRWNRPRVSFLKVSLVPRFYVYPASCLGLGDFDLLRDAFDHFFTMTDNTDKLV